MKHTWKITSVLIVMFFITQLFGIFIVSRYSPETISYQNESGELVNETTYNLPYWMDPPEGITPGSSLVSIVFALIFAVFIMLILIKYKIELVLRIWFFVVVALALGISINAIVISFPYSQLISILLAIPLAFFKIFKRNIILHNLTEMAIYPGIASIFVPLLNIWSVVILLIFISIYDIYAVWHAGFMQKMAKYQIQKLKLFSGFFIPYLGKKERQMIKDIKKSGKKNAKNVKVSVAILGGGDVVFPIILAGVVLNSLGILHAIIISIGATLALGALFLASKKGKFYPAMPFITAGCLVALGITLLI